ncbi:hypothetical protein KC19_VG226600 [Ceratodon purpureus]|uniref:Uncharacterized protein n=1 Tax=Ceratodon purpureus TaxID=3225 RepID=A0A8T0HTB5_CERPU|nr:hypothetical protein KC19_VG226600 [Ceratodon purpureus]
MLFYRKPEPAYCHAFQLFTSMSGCGGGKSAQDFGTMTMCILFSVDVSTQRLKRSTSLLRSCCLISVHIPLLPWLRDTTFWHHDQVHCVLSICVDIEDGE